MLKCLIGGVKYGINVRKQFQDCCVKEVSHWNGGRVIVCREGSHGATKPISLLLMAI